jgi:hypothetical protein
MAVIALITLTASSPIDPILPTLQKHLKASGAQFSIGTKVSEPSVIQITTEWPLIPSASALSSSPIFKSLLDNISSAGYYPTTVFASLDKSPFQPSTAAIVEWVKTDAPSLLSAEKQKQMENDFARFESIYRKRGVMSSVGEVSLSVGWSEDHLVTDKDGKEGVVKSWIVVRGWQGMEFFEEAVKSEEFKECLPILMGWGLPFELVSLYDRWWVCVKSANRV